jgi:AcrR family transcriptional regulator
VEDEMPKISEEQKARRREQILAGARRCFAEHGYEGATVVRLEQETGLSRGAIFNYFRSKDELFLELSFRDSEQLVRLWLEKGWEAALREVAAEDPDWLGVYLEIARKLRTDPDFRHAHEGRLERELVPMLLDHVRAQQGAGALRSDRPPEQLAGFIGLVANGVVVQMATGEPIRNLEALIAFVSSAVRDPDPARTPSRTRA